jgi:hypothetical protein
MSSWYPGTAALLTAGCQSAEFEREVTTLLSGLNASPTQKELDAAKLTLQDTYHRYRRTNPCASNGLVVGHRCLTEIYTDAYEKLSQLQFSRTPPARTSRTQRKDGERNDGSPAAPNVKPDKATLIGEIDETATDT